MRLEELIRWAAFAALLLILAPGQIYLQTHYYAQLGEPSVLRNVVQAIGGALCFIEAIALPLIVAAFKRGERIKAAAFSLVLLPLMAITFIADLGAISAHLESDRAVRLHERAERVRAEQELREAEADLAAMEHALPESLRGRTVEALTIERDSIARRISSYEIAPIRLERRETEILSAIATRTALDDTRAHRDELRQILTAPPPEAEHPQIVVLRRAAAMAGHHLGADDLITLTSIALVLVIKFTTMTGFSIATPSNFTLAAFGAGVGQNTAHAASAPPNAPAQTQSVPATTQTTAPPSAAIQSAPTSPSQAQPPMVSTPTSTTKRKKGKGAPQVANALLHALGGKPNGASPPT